MTLEEKDKTLEGGSGQPSRMEGELDGKQQELLGNLGMVVHEKVGNLMIVSDGSRYSAEGVMDTEGNQILSAKYSNIQIFDGVIVAFNVERLRYEVFDLRGKEIIDNSFYKVEIGEGLILATFKRGLGEEEIVKLDFNGNIIE